MKKLKLKNILSGGFNIFESQGKKLKNILSGGSQAGVGQAAEASSQDGGNYHLSCSHNVIIVLDETRIKD